MRCAVVVFLGVLSAAVGSYESGPGYGVSHASYGASPAHTPAVGWNSGHAGGSYYHYHVPLVGQQGHHYQAHAPQQSDHHLHYILPLLLLAALPLLLLPLLPLLLLPLGLSLLALLLPLLMMGGMMMMMMMMDGGMMMMMRNSAVRNPGGYGGNEARNFGAYVLNDITNLVGRYARSLDLDHCPERIWCEAGNLIFPANSNTTAQTARSWMDFLVESAAPKGKTRRMLRSYKKAFWTGSSSGGKCAEFKCQPVFRLVEPQVVLQPAHNSTNYSDYFKMTKVNGTLLS